MIELCRPWNMPKRWWLIWGVGLRVLTLLRVQHHLLHDQQRQQTRAEVEYYDAAVAGDDDGEEREQDSLGDERGQCKGRGL